MKRLYLILIWVGLFATACGSSNTPKLIASAPFESTNNPKLIYPSTEVIYNAILEIEASNPQKAADRAEDLAYRYGGYLISSRSWYVNGEKYNSVVLAVPSANYDNLYNAVSGLGNLISSTVTGQLVESPPSRATSTATITANFHRGGFDWPSLPHIGWNPGETISSAFRVFLTIFGFIADIFLWVLIVFGPFVLMAWGAWAIVRKVNKP